MGLLLLHYLWQTTDKQFAILRSFYLHLNSGETPGHGFLKQQLKTKFYPSDLMLSPLSSSQSGCLLTQAKRTDPAGLKWFTWRTMNPILCKIVRGIIRDFRGQSPVDNGTLKDRKLIKLSNSSSLCRVC